MTPSPRWLEDAMLRVAARREESAHRKAMDAERKELSVKDLNDYWRGHSDGIGDGFLSRAPRGYESQNPTDYDIGHRRGYEVSQQQWIHREQRTAEVVEAFKSNQLHSSEDREQLYELLGGRIESVPHPIWQEADIEIDDLAELVTRYESRSAVERRSLVDRLGNHIHDAVLDQSLDQSIDRSSGRDGRER